MSDSERQRRIRQPEESRRLLTTPEAAKRLGFRPITLEIWRMHKQGPRFYRIGRNVRYDPRDLDAYIEANAVQPNGE